MHKKKRYTFKYRFDGQRVKIYKETRMKIIKKISLLAIGEYEYIITYTSFFLCI